MNQTTDGDSPDSRSNPTRLIAILIGSLLGFLVVLVAIRSFIGGSLVKIASTDVAAAKQVWQDHQIADYRIRIQIQGPLNGVYEVHVADGNTTKKFFENKELTDERTRNIWTVPGMFRMLEMDLAKQQQLVKQGINLVLKAEFDQEYGYPLQYQRLDQSTRQSITWEVIEFTIQ